MSTQHIVKGLVAATALAIAGCGSGKGTVPVEGAVTLDGAPVEGASVSFVPAQAGRGAQAQTDAAGKFSLMTFEAKDGALPGSYKVGVSKLQALDAKPDPASTAPAGVQLSGPPMGGGPPPAPKSLLPEKYANPNTSGITVDVKSGMSPVKLELTSK